MAVYTEVGDDDIRALLKGYAIGEATSLKGIAEGVENSNFLLATTAGTYILTLYEKRVKTQDIPFFLRLMQHFSSKGVPCPEPIANTQGAVQASICGKQATIISFLEGMWPRSIEPWHCEEVGKIAATMHLAAQSFGETRANALSMPACRDLFEGSKPKADSVAPGMADVVSEAFEYILANWPKGLQGGVVHADLFPDNVFFQNKALSGVIDFYFACNDFFAYDLAIILNAWCFEKDFSFNVTKARALFKGYESIRVIPAEEKEALPVLLTGAAARFLCTRLHDWLNRVEGALVVPKNPLEYYEKLRLHRGISSFSEYGI